MLVFSEEHLGVVIGLWVIVVSLTTLNDDADTCADDRLIDVCFDELDIAYIFVSPDDKAEAVHVDEIVESIFGSVTTAVSKGVSSGTDVKFVDGDIAGTDFTVDFSDSLFKLKICDAISLLNGDVFAEAEVDIVLFVSRVFVSLTEKVQKTL